MCFSAEASFAGGAIITAIGVAAIRKVRKPSNILFASIPLIFGVQQISEGFVWLSLQWQGHEAMLNISSYAFLIAAVVIWPALIPLSVLKMEESEKKKKTLRFIMAAGIMTSLYYASGLLIFNIYPEINSHHIKYANDFPEILRLPVFFIYLIATLAPFFISGIRRMSLLGIIMAVSCLITGIFFREYLTSVWCFFAALISGVIYLIIIDMEKTST